MQTDAILNELKTLAKNHETAIELFTRRLDKFELAAQRPGALPESHDLATKLWNSAEYKAFREGPRRGRLYFSVGSFAPPQIRTTITSSTVGSATPGVLVPERVVEGVISPGVRQLRIRDLLPVRPTGSNVIEWPKEAIYANAASPQVEASDKYESAITFQMDSAPVRTLAHWIPASRQVLDDFRELQAHLNRRLIEGLLDKEDQQLLTGDGTGVQVSGFSTEADAYQTSRNQSGDTRLDKLSHGLTQVAEANVEPDGIIVHPADFEAIRLLKDEAGGANTGNYLLGNPGAQVQIRTIWNVPCVVTTAMTSGYFLVGAFQRGALLADRMEAVIDISTEHSDFFVKNLVAIRAEERIALAVFRSDHFVWGSF